MEIIKEKEYINLYREKFNYGLEKLLRKKRLSLIY